MMIADRQQSASMVKQTVDAIVFDLLESIDEVETERASALGKQLALVIQDYPSMALYAKSRMEAFYVNKADDISARSERGMYK